MFKQVIYLLTYRKKSTSFLILLLALVFFLLGSVPQLFSQRDKIWFEAMADSTGIFDGILLDLSPAQREKLLTSDSVLKIGFILDYGRYEIIETSGSVLAGSVQLGSIDKTAIELGRIGAVEGHLPVAEGEIALEAAWRNRLPEGIGIGSVIDIQTAEGEKTYKICGFIEDYTDEWSASEGTNPAVAQLPSAVVLQESAPGDVAKTHALVYLLRLREAEITESQFFDLKSLLSAEDAQVSYNAQLYQSIPPDSHTFQSIFTLAILAGAATVTYISLTYYLQSYQDVARKLYALGATEVYTRKLLLLWVMLLSIAGIALSVAFHAIFSVFTQKYLQASISFSSSLWSIVLILAGLCRIVLLLHRKKIEPFSEMPFSQQNEKIALSEIHLKRNGNSSFALSRAKRGSGRLWGVYVSVAIILALFLCAREDVNNRLGLNFHKGVFTFLSSAQTLSTEERQTFNDFTLTKEKVGFPMEEVEELLDKPGVKSAIMQYMGTSPSLLLNNKDSVYAQALYEKDAKYNRRSTAPAVPKDTWATTADCGNFRIYVLDVYSFKMVYSKIDVKNDLAPGKAVVFCAPIQTEFGGIVTNDLFNVGEEISFGWLETKAAYEEAVNDPSLIEYKEESFQVTQIIEENEDTLQKEKLGIEGAPVIIIISKETAKSTGLCNMINYLKVSMENSITEDNYNAIKTRMGEMVDAFFGMKLDKVESTIKYDTEIVKPVLLVQNFLLVILSIFMLYALFIVLYNSFSPYRRSFGIMRAVGYSKRAILSTILQEFLLYWIQLAVVCYVIIFLAECIYFPVFPYSYWQSFYDGLPYIFRTATAEAGVFMSGVIVVYLIAVGLFSCWLGKKSISSLIRFTE